MTGNIRLLCVAAVVCLLAAGVSLAQQQTTNAKARAVSVSTGRPSSFAIQANILAQKQAQIEQQIEVAQRCIRNSSLPTVLRDPEGNVRVVPQTDIVNCTRTLNSLLRQLESLARQADKLEKDAEAAAFALERRQRQAEAQARILRKSSQ